MGRLHGRPGLISVLAAGVLAIGVAAVPAQAAGRDGVEEDTATTSTAGSTAPASMAAAPYLYFGWGDPPDPVTLMQETGVRWFTLAFILSDGGCNPAWGGTRPLNGSDAEKIARIRNAGGDIIPSIGGWSGQKLGLNCPDAQSLAAAYQEVIDAYDLSAIDIDIENTEFESEAAQDRVLGALKIIEQNNPGITTIVTMPVTQNGLNWWGQRMVRRATETGTPVDVWTIMPFNVGGSGDMGQLSIQITERVHDQLASFYPNRTDAEIYAMQGISSMNGKTDVGETINQQDFREMRSYASQHGLARFTFWSVNRDRPCSGGGSGSCSGIPQQPWEFTSIVAGYGG